MKSNIQKLGALFAGAALAVGALAASNSEYKATTVVDPDAPKPVPKIEDLLPDPVVAKGRSFQIKRSELDDAVRNVKVTAAQSGQEISAAQTPMVEKNVLDRLILVRVLNARATEAEKARGKEEADKQMAEIKKRVPDEAAFQMQLKARGMTMEQLRTGLLEEQIFIAVLRGKVTTTDDQIKKYYQDNPSQFEQPEMVRVTHILISTFDPKTGTDLPDEQKVTKRKTADSLLKKARDGEDFAKLVKDYSEDPAVKQNNGEVKFARDAQGVPPGFESAAFSLKTNQISDVVTSALGYHIIKLNEKIAAHRLELDQDTTKQIKDYLERSEIEKMMPTFYPKVKQEDSVEILDERLKTLEDEAAALEAKQKAGADAEKKADKPK